MTCSQCDRTIKPADPKAVIKDEWWCEECIYYLERQSADELRMQEIRDEEVRFEYESLL